MSELLSAALRLMSPADPARLDGPGEGPLAPLPTALPYADYLRRFDAPAVPLGAVTAAGAAAQLRRLSLTIDTSGGFARERAGRAPSTDSDHLYRAHGDPRD